MDAIDLKLLELAGKVADEDYSAERNPLELDDLALRLAVKLKIDLAFFPVRVTAQALNADRQREEFGADPYAATRRAIVRAAAAIGEGMK